MSTTPRITSAIEGMPADFGSVTAHSPDTMARFFDLYSEFWQRGVLGAEIKELTRLRNARITDCGYWKNVRFDSARVAGLTEEKAALIDEGYEENLSESEAALLALTDLIIGLPRQPEPDLIARLRTHYSDAELVEASLGVGLFLGMSKVLITLGVEPESMPTTVIPTPGS